MLAYAQEKHAVSGRIVGADNKGVPYTSVTFSNTANKMLSDATLTDENGNYTLNLAPGNYAVTVEAINFETVTLNRQIGAAARLDDIKITADSGALATGGTTAIEGVTITAQTKPYRVELDKKVYDVTQDITSKGGNLQDVLQNVPSVAVETDGTVSMRGNSNIKFLINGKPSSLLGIDDGANALQSIPADQIERIEVITNPSSKFESSGTAGILNIILKKSKKIGFNGSVEGSIGWLPRASLNTNLSWRKDALTYYLNVGGGYNEWLMKNNSEFRLKNVAADEANQTVTESTQYSESNNKNANLSVNTGIAYDINDKTSFTLSGLVRKIDGSPEGFTDYNETRISKDPAAANYPNNAYTLVDYYRRRDNSGENDNLSLQGDVGLDHKFNDKGHNIFLSASFQTSKNEGNSTVVESPETIFNSISQLTENQALILKADYELPIGEKSRFEAGARVDANNNDYDYLVEQGTAENNLSVLENYTSNTVYKENINALYTQFRSKITDKFGYQLGLRAEQTNIDLTFRNFNKPEVVVPKNYVNYFPTAFLSYDVTDKDQFLLNYSKRIRRPRSFFLIPFTSYNDNTNIFTGNADLNPSLVDSFEFGYSMQKPKFTLNPTLYYRKTNDDIKMYQERYFEDNSTVDTADDLWVIRTYPINLGTEEQYGLDLNTTFDATRWWKIMANIDLFGYKTTGQYETIDYSGNGFSTRFRLTNTFRPDKKTSVQVQTFYRGGEKSANQETKPMYAVSLGANRTILNGNGTLSFNIQDVFNTRGRKVTFDTAEYWRYSEMSHPGQMTLSFSYRFKQGEKVEQPKRRKNINNNDQGGDEEMPPARP